MITISKPGRNVSKIYRVQISKVKSYSPIIIDYVQTKMLWKAEVIITILTDQLSNLKFLHLNNTEIYSLTFLLLAFYEKQETGELTSVNNLNSIKFRTSHVKSWTNYI